MKYDLVMVFINPHKMECVGSKVLGDRRNWQTRSGKKARQAEDVFLILFQNEFQEKNYEIIKEPDYFKHIYENINLKKNIKKGVYKPKDNFTHGIKIDFAIKNTKTNKILFVEIKRQNGWTNSKNSKEGRGNAHERSCKFFTPGLLKILRKKGKLSKKILPFWLVLIGDITRDPKRTREITMWYDEYDNHYFFWQNTEDLKTIVRHFNEKLKPLLEK